MMKMMRRKWRSSSPAPPEGSRRSGHLPLVVPAHLEQCWSHAESEPVTGPPDAGVYLGEVALLFVLL